MPFFSSSLLLSTRYIWECSLCISSSRPLFLLHATFGSVLCAFPLLHLASFYTLHLGVFFVQFVSSLLFTRYIWECSLCISSPLFFFLHATFGSVLCAFPLPSSPVFFSHATFEETVFSRCDRLSLLSLQPLPLLHLLPGRESWRAPLCRFQDRRLEMSALCRSPKESRASSHIEIQISLSAGRV